MEQRILENDLGVHYIGLEDMVHHKVALGSSNCMGMYIQGTAADFAGTIDSIAAVAAAEEHLSHQAEIDQPLLFYLLVLSL